MFDPYHKWLGILPKDQPPNYYRLLGVETLESDLDVIEGAAERQMGFIRQYQSGEHAAEASRILNELATARLCLLKPALKASYDAKLCEQGPALPEFLAPNEGGNRFVPKRDKRSFAANRLVIAVGGVAVITILAATASIPHRTSRQTPVSRPVATGHSERAKATPIATVPAVAHQPAPPAVSVSASHPIDIPLTTAGEREQPAVAAVPATTDAEPPLPAPEAAPNVAEPVPVRAAIPSPEQQKEIAKLLESTYGLTRLQGVARKQEAIKKLTEASRDRNLAVDERYVVLTTLISVATDASDAASCLDAINALIATYDLDPSTEKTRLLTEFLKASKPGTQLKPAVDETIRLAQHASKENRFADAMSLLAAADGAVRRATSADSLKKMVYAARETVTGREKERKAFEAASKKLGTDADDPAANFATGRWHAVQQADWTTALPFLVKAGDATWKAAAMLELASPTDPTKQAAIGDAWYEIAEKESGVARTALLLHAGAWYEVAQPTLNAGLMKQLVVKRLTEIAPLREWNDLLEWAEGVDWAPRGIDWNNRIEGKPTRNGITLRADDRNRFPLPAIIEGDYDFEVEFTRHDGNDAVGIFFPVGIRNMRVEFGTANGATAGMGWIGGMPPTDPRNPTIRRPSPVENNRRHSIRARVRNDGIRAAVNIDWDTTKDFFQWEGPMASLRSFDDRAWTVPLLRHPWLLSHRGRVTFHAARVRTASGSISRDVVSDAHREQDRKSGFIRLVNEKATRSSSSPGWGTITFTQMSPEAVALEVESAWPMITRDFKSCDDFYGAHAPSKLTCPIPASARSFSVIGYNETSRTTNYQILVDGKKVHDSGATDVAVIRVDIPAKASLLELVADPAGDPSDDFSYWCFPRFHAVAAERLTDKMLDDDSGKHLFRVAASAVGYDVLTHNKPIAPLQSVPIHFRDYQPCDEFIFAHAASAITYDVPDGMTCFTAIGYKAVWKHHVKFEVWADGIRIYQSPQAGVVPINLKLPPRTTSIELKVDHLGDQLGDHSMWCYPRLHRK